MKRFVIGILAHVDAGKTTMSEAILYETGKLKKMGRVDNRDAFLRHFRAGTRPGHHDLFEAGGLSVRRRLRDAP